LETRESVSIYTQTLLCASQSGVRFVVRSMGLSRLSLGVDIRLETRESVSIYTQTLLCASQ
jgi:hypothetical protein